MLWLAEQFGWERMRTTRVILPTPEFFPDPYNGSLQDAARMLDRVCGYMDIPPGSVELSLYEDRNPVYEGEWRHGTAGLYHEEQGKFRVWIEVANLNDPLGLVGTLAHEIGHVHLLGHRRITDDVADHEPLTDLLTVFLGMGVFTANSVIHENYWHSGQVSGWSMGRKGYLTMPMYGYAFALFARARAEACPTWARELRLDVRSAFFQGVKYLSEIEATGFDHEGLTESPKSPGGVAQGTEGASPASKNKPIRRQKNRTRRTSSARKLVCTYCGARIPTGNSGDSSDGQSADRTASHEFGVCQACHASVQENEQDVDDESIELARDAVHAQAIYRKVILVVAGAIALILAGMAALALR